MSIEEVQQVAEGLANNKAKLKTLKTEPADTKDKKLHKDVQKGLEQHFKIKLAKVRVHTGGNLKKVCKQLKSKSFTVGENIYFGKAGDAKDPALLAHELTHVIQKSQGKMPKKAKPGTALVCK